MLNDQFINKVIAISKIAGNAILEVYHSDFNFEIKEDSSPVTHADKISHSIICEKLSDLTPNIPILSEEDSSITYDMRSKWKKYWLIDPLDGTKEFIKRNGEFTVNIALIENHIPILGIIYLPVLKETYWGSEIRGSYYCKNDGKPEKINVTENIKYPIKIMASRSHPSDQLDFLLEEISDYRIISKGSSLKFCYIARGQADIYPRFGPTSEWDIAAGEAIIKYAGGHMKAINGSDLKYNLRESLINPYFLASSNSEYMDSLFTIIKKYKK